MDLRAVIDGSGGRWTEERHSRFLNWIESSFVNRMLDLHSDSCSFHRYAVRLDRRVPDSATESTEDSRIRSPPPSPADPDPQQAPIVSSRKRSLRRYDASLEQVVPELKNKGYGEDLPS